MAYLSITSIKCTSKISDEEFEGDALVNKIDSFRAELEKLLSRNGFVLREIENVFLHEKKYSVCECKRCGKLMSNRDENPIGYEGNFIEDIVLNGGVYKGEVLCELCLPREHRWSSFG